MASSLMFQGMLQGLQQIQQLNLQVGRERRETARQRKAFELQERAMDEQATQFTLNQGRMERSENRAQERFESSQAQQQQQFDAREKRFAREAEFRRESQYAQLRLKSLQDFMDVMRTGAAKEALLRTTPGGSSEPDRFMAEVENILGGLTDDVDESISRMEASGEALAAPFTSSMSVSESPSSGGGEASGSTSPGPEASPSTPISLGDGRMVVGSKAEADQLNAFEDHLMRESLQKGNRPDDVIRSRRQYVSQEDLNDEELRELNQRLEGSQRRGNLALQQGNEAEIARQRVNIGLQRFSEEQSTLGLDFLNPDLTFQIESEPRMIATAKDGEEGEDQVSFNFSLSDVPETEIQAQGLVAGLLSAAEAEGGMNDSLAVMFDQAATPAIREFLTEQGASEIDGKFTWDPFSNDSKLAPVTFAQIDRLRSQIEGAMGGNKQSLMKVQAMPKPSQMVRLFGRSIEDLDVVDDIDKVHGHIATMSAMADVSELDHRDVATLLQLDRQYGEVLQVSPEYEPMMLKLVGSAMYETNKRTRVKADMLDRSDAADNLREAGVKAVRPTKMGTGILPDSAFAPPPGLFPLGPEDNPEARARNNPFALSIQALLEDEDPETGLPLRFLASGQEGAGFPVTGLPASR